MSPAGSLNGEARAGPRGNRESRLTRSAEFCSSGSSVRDLQAAIFRAIRRGRLGSTRKARAIVVTLHTLLSQPDLRWYLWNPLLQEGDEL